MVKHPMVRLVDDDDLFRTSQAMLLQVNGFSVATFSSAAEFLERDDPHRPGSVSYTHLTLPTIA